MRRRLSLNHRLRLACNFHNVAQPVFIGALLALGCASWSRVPVSALPQEPANLRLYLRDGDTVIVQAAVVRADSIIGVRWGSATPGLRMAVALTQVERTEVARTDRTGTALLIFGLVIVGYVALMGLALLAYSNEGT